MFNYLFPIFCFGLVITGIVYLGVLEAAKQVKVESKNELKPASTDDLFSSLPSRNGQLKGPSPRFAARTNNE